MIASVYPRSQSANFGTQTASATTLPLTTELADIEVRMINGTAKDALDYAITLPAGTCAAAAFPIGTSCT